MQRKREDKRKLQQIRNKKRCMFDVELLLLHEEGRDRPLGQRFFNQMILELNFNVNYLLHCACFY